MLRCSFFAYSGCVDSSDVRVLEQADVLVERASISSVRCTTKIARPRHSTRSNAPGSSLLMSTVTGAPSACARALGLKEATNGTAVAIAPAPPVTTVATVKKCRLVKPVLSATKHPLTDGVKHQEASLNNH